MGSPHENTEMAFFLEFRSGESVNCAKGGFAITALGKNSLSIKLFVSAAPEAHRDVKSSEQHDRVCAISLSTHTACAAVLISGLCMCNHGSQYSLLPVQLAQLAQKYLKLIKQHNKSP